ncbi:uncharacterized protein LOC130647600 [Hydractinia symbiolongicarpus]|uniref:uncharacterized protein LOC130647600 n=1 Tax=Hydractinia symbiolongicarpus TaxID=13093 RepID=UPI00254C2CAC|nr:uncharacterized protein LOC130647600 [Hydractinia symbiolongicarpus]
MFLYLVLTFSCMYIVRYFLLFLLKSPHQKVRAGYQEDLIFPFEQEFELYYANVSTNSMKVRMCLEEAGLAYKSHVVKLPKSGSFETKTSSFLQINPAGTVPVLLHNGHPVYESSEQLIYIAKYVGKNNILIPSDLQTQKCMMRFLEITSVFAHEIMDDVDKALEHRVGNCIYFFSLPLFIAMAARFNVKIKFYTLLQTIYMLLINTCSRKQLIQTCIALFGLNTIKYIHPMRKIIMKMQKYLLDHLMHLEQHLKENSSKKIIEVANRNDGRPIEHQYLHGNLVFIDDMCWAAIFYRLKNACWLDDISTKKFPLVHQYWRSLQCLPSFKKVTMFSEKESVEERLVQSQIRMWKRTQPWFLQLYTGNISELKKEA